MKTTLLALVALLCLTFAASAADISGKWVVDAAAAPAGGPPAGGPGGPGGGGGRGMGGGTYEFKVAGSTLTGSVTQMGRGGDPTVTPLADGKVTGDTFTFSITRNMGGEDMKIVYNGKVVGDKLEVSFDAMGRGVRTVTLKKAQ